MGLTRQQDYEFCRLQSVEGLDLGQEYHTQWSNVGKCKGSTFWHRCNCAGSSRGVKCVAHGLLFWLVMLPLMLLIMCLITILYGLFFSVPWWLWMVVRGKVPKNWTICAFNADFHEDKVIRSRFPPGTCSEWVQLDPRQGASVFSSAPWQAHRVIVPYQGSEPSPQTLVVIHGSSSSATLMMSSCAALLSKMYLLHCVDLPCYGRTTPPAGVSKEDVNAMSPMELVNMQCEFIERYCRTCGLARPLVVAHSAGAYYAMMWACSYRDKSTLEGVLLVSLAGCLPTFNNWAAPFGVGFKIGQPQKFLMLLGNLGSFVFQPLVYGNPLKLYWQQLQASKSTILVAHKFCRISVCSAIWLYPSLMVLLRGAHNTSKFALVIGRYDTMASHSENVFISDLAARLNIFLPCITVPGAGHIVFHHDNGRAIVKGVASAHKALTTAPDPHPLSQVQLLDFEQRAARSTWNHTYSSFHIFTTRVRRHQLYSLLLSFVTHKPAQNGTDDADGEREFPRSD
jgi:pimeloyl-ACP methyl ester carboxylesterase